MIRFALKCSRGHSFESWFADGAAYEQLHAAGQVECPECGDRQVEKALMAPGVPARDAEARAARLQQFRDAVESGTEDVGRRFAQEARAMHLGDQPERAIRGEASLGEAKALLDDGVPILPLPFVGKDKQN